MTQIDQLSDDPAIARQQLEDLAGPGATILIDSFEGGQLPNKSQIRSIRISRDQFAAESHSAGGIRIEIVTQPGQGDIRGQARTNFYTSRMDGSNPLVDRAPPAQNLNSGMNLSGGLLKDRMSFNLNWSGSNNYTSPVQIASGSSNTDTRVLPIKTRTTRKAIPPASIGRSRRTRRHDSASAATTASAAMPVWARMTRRSEATRRRIRSGTCRPVTPARLAGA